MAELGVWIIINTSQPLCVNEILHSQYKKDILGRYFRKTSKPCVSEKKQVTKQNEECACH